MSCVGGRCACSLVVALVLALGSASLPSRSLRRGRKLTVGRPAGIRDSVAMSWLRDQALQRVGALFIIALTLVPVALSGHHHRITQSSTSDQCPICVATHHAPAASPAPLPRLAPIFHSFPLATTPVAAPAHAPRPFRNGRAPPLLFAARIV
jgi:hypothetical protein